jgi:hypothetical protein
MRDLAELRMLEILAVHGRAAAQRFVDSFNKQLYDRDGFVVRIDVPDRTHGDLP